MEDFFVRALLGGVGVALVSGPFGCVVVWRRMAYFGHALAHSALLGVALGFLLGIDLTLGVIAVCVLAAALLTTLEGERTLAADTLLGILAHGSLALGLVVLAFMESVRADLMGYLFGDVLAISTADLYLIYAVAAISLIVLARQWRALLSATVDEEVAAVEGVAVGRVRALFVLMLAVVVAVGMKVVGILLIVSLLIVPAAAARSFSRTPEAMAVGASALGAACVLVGLAGSLRWDVPAGPLIVVVSVIAFALSFVHRRRSRARASRAAAGGS